MSTEDLASNTTLSMLRGMVVLLAIDRSTALNSCTQCNLYAHENDIKPN